MKTILPILCLSLLLVQCKKAENNDDLSRYQPKPYVELKHPDWSKNATIYENELLQGF